MIYAIAGVSGNTGKVAAEALLAAGKKVRVIVRDAAKGQSWKDRGAEVAVADLTDVPALTKALTGVAGAYLLCPPNMAAEDFAAHQKTVITALAEAVAHSGVPHVVLLSSVGAQHPSGTGPISAMHHAEKAIGAVGTTSLTSLRAAYFMENLGGSLGMLDKGILGTFVPAGVKLPMVATKDIGLQAAKWLVEGPRSRLHIVELSSATHDMNDVAAALTTILGKPIAVGEAPIAAMVSTLMGYGFKQKLAEMYAEMTAAFSNGTVVFEGTHTTAHGSTTLDTVLRQLLGAK